MHFKVFLKKAFNKIKRIVKESLSSKDYPTDKPVIFCWRLHDWKRDFLQKCLKDYRFDYLDFKLSANAFVNKWQSRILSRPDNQILIWSVECPDFIIDFANKHNIRYEFVEDGFIRSVGLGAYHILPHSLVFDDQTLYYDCRKESKLEKILATYDFNADKALMQRARALKSRILEAEISKYNHAEKVNIKSIYGPKNKKRILVIGQVEDDQSVIYGCSEEVRNNDLVRLAYSDNPDCQIIYKPHPDVIAGKRKMLSDPADVEDIATVVKVDMPIVQAFETVDHVYTITSLGGFEALLRGLSVTTLGCPFYAGWGVTDTRQAVERRKRKLTVDEIFAAAYILYPKYYDTELCIETTPEKVLEKLISEKSTETFTDEAG